MLTTSCLSSAKYSFVSQADLPLVISLNHPEARIRSLAVEQLYELYNSNTHGYDHTFFPDALTARLVDDDSSVVNAVVSKPSILVAVLDSEQLINCIMKLMQRGDEDIQLNRLTVAAMKSIDSSSLASNDFAFGLFGHILHTIKKKGNRKLLSAMEEADCTSKHPLLKALHKAVKGLPLKALSKSSCDSKTQDEALQLIFTSIAKDYMGDKKSFVDSIIKYYKNLPVDSSLKSCILILLAHIVMVDANAEITPTILYSDIIPTCMPLESSTADNLLSFVRDCESLTAASNTVISMINKDESENKDTSVSKGKYVLVFCEMFLFESVMDTLSNAG